MADASKSLGEALVTATYGRRFDLLPDGGQPVTARVRGRRLKPVCGDRVAAAPIDNEDDWLITGIEHRRNELTRPDKSGRPEVLAANLDFVVVVTAGSPAPDWFIVDRYLAAAELMPAGAALVYNKVDEDPAPDELAVYADIDYPVLSTSAKSGAGIDALRELLSGRTAICVGQSGVGKSSLINRLAPEHDLRTGEISGKTGEGRHTTVNSVMIFLDNGGAIIDSPGVRDFAPAIADARDVAAGFRDISAAAAECRYANCRHLKEPQCAVKARVESGRISERRYESYRRLLRLTEGFADRY